jgi:putative transposase
MKQVARNLTDVIDGFLRGKRHLIMDRDPVFTEALRALLLSSGLKSVRLPARSPNLNAFAERFVRSVRDECLSTLIPLSETYLRELLRYAYGEPRRCRASRQALASVACASSNRPSSLAAASRC